MTIRMSLAVAIIFTGLGVTGAMAASDVVKLSPIGQTGGVTNTVSVAGNRAYVGVGPRLRVAPFELSSI